MSLFSDIIILAGGIGERLYPASTKEHPKQFIPAIGGKSFFQMALERALALRPSGEILVITRKNFVAIAGEQCKDFADTLHESDRHFLENALVILGEPCPKHTAAAIQCAGTYITAKYADAESRLMLVLTSDHIIEPLNTFMENCRNASLEAQAGYFVCFGIRPTRADAGYGYIKTETEANRSSGRDIVSFHEKPDEETAKRYLAEKNYWWNSGMFAFKTGTFIEEMRKYTPAVYEAFSPLCGSKPVYTKQNGINSIAGWNGLEAAYGKTPSLAVDRALAEKTSRASCVIADFSWQDVGSWDAFCECIPEAAEHVEKIESSGCYVYSDIPVAVCGVDEVMVIIRNGRALVMKKGKSNLIGKVLNRG
ncbi:MAG: mannose-1-phosphate guanylyltransferase [Treponema sp.]|jgi:mannose-1-phosphate guanylyltransferase/mannose-6-phosphate isomerase|nr:mannose-1-phosphate guanylyltransferase [Treponema sp.]